MVDISDRFTKWALGRTRQADRPARPVYIPWYLSFIIFALKKTVFTHILHFCNKWSPSHLQFYKPSLFCRFTPVLWFSPFFISSHLLRPQFLSLRKRSISPIALTNVTQASYPWQQRQQSQSSHLKPCILCDECFINFCNSLTNFKMSQLVVFQVTQI